MTRKIAVVGGGVIGCSIAWHLAERDLGEIVLIERDQLGSGTTWHSAGTSPGGPIRCTTPPCSTPSRLSQS